MLLSCGLIPNKGNLIKFVVDEAGYGSGYNWSMILLQDFMIENYFNKMSVRRFHKY